MGIKGIYKEIGPGRRIALCKLAVEHLEQTGRPLRIAIDIAIWQFQAQAAKGGSNPAVRTLFYRLVRLLSLPIHPIFVFDGANKPAFKRNRRSGKHGDTVATAMAKRLIRLFGCAAHEAPGEAEAECALLQRAGVVDCVLSEDVDTIMFGCTRTLRSWSADGVKGSKTPTHVSLYDSAELKTGETGLDREGMVLVALMSGGDYLPEGVPGCGVKVACEAAKGGFGRTMCQLKRSDTAALKAWRESLLHEWRENESGCFRTRHKALAIPEDFPNMDILRYYTHPVVSQTAAVDRLKANFPAMQPVRVDEMREFVQETFDWTYRTGAVKLVRVLAPCLLTQKLLRQATDDATAVEKSESDLVHKITSRRSHSSTDATPELRLSYTPADIVGIDLDDEPEAVTAAHGRDGLALNSDDEFGEQLEEDQVTAGGSRKQFNPLQPDVVWIPESVAKLGIPKTVEEWESTQRSKLAKKSMAKAPRRRVAKKADMPTGSLDKFVKTTKNVPLVDHTLGSSQQSLTSSGIPSPTKWRNLPPMSQDPLGRKILDTVAKTASKPATISRSKQTTATTPKSKPSSQTNPWTLASSQARARVAAAGADAAAESTSQAITIPSSSPHPPHSPLGAPLRRVHALSSFADDDDDPFASSPLACLSLSSQRGQSSQPQPPEFKLPKATQSAGSEAKTATRAPRETVKTAKTANRPVVTSSQASIKAFGLLVEPKARAGFAASGGKAAREEMSLPEVSSDDYDSDLPSLSDLLGRKTPAPRPGNVCAVKKADGRGGGGSPFVVFSSPPPPTAKGGLASGALAKVFKEGGNMGVMANGRGGAGKVKGKSKERSPGRAWRESQISIVDLTGDD